MLLHQAHWLASFDSMIITHRKIPPLYIITPERIVDFNIFLDTLVRILSSIPKNSIMLQLREKKLCDREFLSLACRIQNITKKYDTLFLINERIDIALLCQADGVHLTSTSITSKQARRLLKNKIIGVSTHSADEVIQSYRDRADFVTLGPIFETQSKIGFGKPLGISVLSVQKKISLPIFALGGIQSNNIESIVKTHKALAMISMVWDSPDPVMVIQSILSKIQ